MGEVALLTQEHENIAQAMLQTRGNLAKASRLDTVTYNAMSLRAVVREYPEIRKRYNELLAGEMMERGLHVAERILEIADLKDEAMGGEIEITNEAGEKEMIPIPSDPKLVIDLSKELSRLIAEGKGGNVSEKSAIMLVSKEGAADLLSKFLDS